EGFSLIESHKWLKVMHRSDCLLFGSKTKNENRMFRVQFSGDSKEKSVEHCSSCVKKLQLYVSVQVSEGHSQPPDSSQTQPGCSDLPPATEVQRLECEAVEPEAGARSMTLEGKLTVPQLAQSMMGLSKLALPLAYQHSTWSTEELGPFLHLCLLDQNFPAFVEGVEGELRKLIED
uniref:REC114 meiotic recombination protein n=2 Tax=Latimeria chalumnae TaxID=7897 RepID=H3B9L5_LATCH